MLSSELEFCLNEAFQRAREQRHEFMTVEHLLLALLDIPKVHEIIKACNGNIPELRRQLTEFIDEQTPLLQLDDENDVQPTLGFQRVLQRAVFHVQSSGKKEVTGTNVLVAIFSEKQSQAVYFLGLQDITRLDVINYISHGLPQVAGRERRGGAGDPAGGRGRNRIDGARAIRDQPQSARDRRTHRSAHRSRNRDRAYRADPLPPPQEQSALRGRRRGRQDRIGGGACAHDRRGARARSTAAMRRSTHSTWAR